MATANGRPPAPALASSNDYSNLPKPAQRALRANSASDHDSNGPVTSPCNCLHASMQHIPLVYRLWHFWIEPATALSGVYQLHWAPDQYFAFMPQTARYAAESQIVYNQLAAAYLFLAIVEGLVLRTTRELRVWRAVVFALLISDVGHLYAAWLEMGTRGFVCAWAWRSHDAVTMVSFLVPLALRVAFLMNVVEQTA